MIELSVDCLQSDEIRENKLTLDVIVQYQKSSLKILIHFFVDNPIFLANKLFGIHCCHNSSMI